MQMNYPVNVTSETQKKKLRAQLLKECPETLRTDFTHLNNKRVKSDLLFYRENPEAWHSALRKAYKNLKMSGNKVMSFI